MTPPEKRWPVETNEMNGFHPLSTREENKSISVEQNGTKESVIKDHSSKGSIDSSVEKGEALLEDITTSLKYTSINGAC